MFITAELKTLMSSASALWQRGKNWISALLQSGSGALVFMHVSRHKVTTFSTRCLV